ncbi:hypothetical protein E2C01_042195 [Portunus trituberculatus]|uniref:Uncharacterized protein n=1 Tax=Portunus trituberculatus TaxID=210409 RepID=A0A5B7FTY3_PORTR|nr:hypothetical protein [Portunus trituberculatus]
MTPSLQVFPKNHFRFREVDNVAIRVRGGAMSASCRRKNERVASVPQDKQTVAIRTTWPVQRSGGTPAPRSPFPPSVYPSAPWSRGRPHGTRHSAALAGTRAASPQGGEPAVAGMT